MEYLLCGRAGRARPSLTRLGAGASCDIVLGIKNIGPPRADIPTRQFPHPKVATTRLHGQRDDYTARESTRYQAATLQVLLFLPDAALQAVNVLQVVTAIQCDAHPALIESY